MNAGSGLWLFIHQLNIATPEQKHNMCLLYLVPDTATAAEHI